mmetsp:Transcript_18742/g.29040  ORF Transcript_18742/g.29040 Transcript_18742/m.29040 type:complete len:314 (-) Transcript_18742:39-980(-)
MAKPPDSLHHSYSYSIIYNIIYIQYNITQHHNIYLTIRTTLTSHNRAIHLDIQLARLLHLTHGRRHLPFHTRVGIDVKDLQLGDQEHLLRNRPPKSIRLEFDPLDHTVVLVITRHSVPLALVDAHALPSRVLHPRSFRVGGVVETVHGVSLLEAFVRVRLVDVGVREDVPHGGVLITVRVFKVRGAVQGDLVEGGRDVGNDLGGAFLRVVHDGRHDEADEENGQAGKSEGNDGTAAAAAAAGLDKVVGGFDFFDGRELIMFRRRLSVVVVALRRRDVGVVFDVVEVFQVEVVVVVHVDRGSHLGGSCCCCCRY